MKFYLRRFFCFFCFNSKDGAIDSRSCATYSFRPLFVSIPKMVRLIDKHSKLVWIGKIAVSIPKMVRLIETSDRCSECPELGFNSKDGAIDRL